MVGTERANGARSDEARTLNLWPILIVNTMAVAGMAAVSVWARERIPEGTKIPIHWNLEGVPDRFAEAGEVIYIMPAMGVAMTLLFLVLPWLDPRRENMAASSKFWNAGGILSVLLIAYVHGILLLNATGTQIDVLSALVPALCVMFAIIGNYLGKTRPNWFGGVRTPWTLSSDYAWEKTHRLSGRLFVLSAVAGLGAWAALGPVQGFIALIVGVIGSAIVSIIASYLFWRADPARSK